MPNKTINNNKTKRLEYIKPTPITPKKEKKYNGFLVVVYTPSVTMLLPLLLLIKRLAKVLPRIQTRISNNPNINITLYQELYCKTGLLKNIKRAKTMPTILDIISLYLAKNLFILIKTLYSI